MILIVDDDKELATTLQQVLSSSGLKSVTANSAVEAIDIFGSMIIDIVITDYNLGAGINGRDLCDIIKNRYDIPVILMTGDDAISKEIGKWDELLMKPFDAMEMKNAIRKCLSTRMLSHK